MMSYPYLPDTVSLFTDPEQYVYQIRREEIERESRIRLEKIRIYQERVTAYKNFAESLQTLFPERADLHTFFNDEKLYPLVHDQVFEGIKFGMASGRIQFTPFFYLIQNLSQLINFIPQDNHSHWYVANRNIVLQSLLLVKEMTIANMKTNRGSIEYHSRNKFYWEQILDLSNVVAAAYAVNQHPTDANMISQLDKTIGIVYNPDKTKSTAKKCLALAVLTLVGLAVIALAFVFPVGIWAIPMVIFGMASSIMPAMEVFETMRLHSNQKNVQEQAANTSKGLHSLSFFVKHTEKTNAPEPTQTSFSTPTI